MRAPVPSLAFAAFLLATFGLLSGTSCWVVILAFAAVAVILGAMSSIRIHDEMMRLRTEGPSEEELAKAKDYLTGSYALGFDTSTKIAHQLTQIAFEGLGIDYIARRNALVAAVTQEDIHRAAERTLADGEMLVVVAGRPTA